MPPPGQGGTKKKKKGRAPKHQNSFGFKHNPKSKKTDKILSSPNVGVCRRCHDKIEWRKKYRKVSRFHMTCYTLGHAVGGNIFSLMLMWAGLELEKYMLPIPLPWPLKSHLSLSDSCTIGPQLHHSTNHVPSRVNATYVFKRMYWPPIIPFVPNVLGAIRQLLPWKSVKVKVVQLLCHRLLIR